jgi:hypothetical protein
MNFPSAELKWLISWKLISIENTDWKTIW